MRYRDTFVKIDLDNIEYNVKSIINKYVGYDYYFGVVKADCYGHNEAIKSIIDGGCNYLTVAILEETLKIREEYKDIPILCLGIIPKEYLNVAYENNITITVNSLEYAKEVVDSKLDLKVHIKLNTGMNRLGIKDKQEFIDTFNLLTKNNFNIEGIYTHIYNASNKIDTINQLNKYDLFINCIDKSKVKIFHTSASEALINYEKLSYINGCRLGLIMYGFTENKNLKLKSTFKLVSKIVQINKVSKNEAVGYNGAYKADKDTLIGVVQIGYADGIIRKNTGRYVYINDKKYKIVGNICMDMLFVEIDESVNIGDEVVILKDNKHIEEVSDYLDTIPYEVLCSVSKRVPRIYK